MTDKFMSGWGLARNAVNVMVVACHTYEQARAIERAAHRRPEMKRISICMNKPKNRPGIVYSWKAFDQLGDIWKSA